MLGGDPGAVLQDQQPNAPGTQQTADGTPEGIFTEQILATTEDVWSELFRASGGTYQPPRLSTFRGQTPTTCGTGQSAMGPFYCSADRAVYIDLAFFEELGRRFGAPGDFAAAYVIAHEVGHHVQNLTGATREADAFGARGASSGSVRLELQADCYAGVWATRANQRTIAERGTPLIEPGDVEEGLTAAAAIGDDTLQREAQGRVAPDSFTHGSSAQRVRWFRTGLQSGDPAACDTFNVPDRRL